VVTIKLELETRLPDAESAMRVVTGDQKWATYSSAVSFGESVIVPFHRGPGTIPCFYRTIRPHREHEMRSIAIDEPGVCLFVCHAVSHGFAVQKRLTGSRSSLGRRLLGSKAHRIRRKFRFPLQGRRIRCNLRQITLVACLSYICIDVVLVAERQV